MAYSRGSISFDKSTAMKSLQQQQQHLLNERVQAVTKNYNDFSKITMVFKSLYNFTYYCWNTLLASHYNTCCLSVHAVMVHNEQTKQGRWNEIDTGGWYQVQKGGRMVVRGLAHRKFFCNHDLQIVRNRLFLLRTRHGKKQLIMKMEGFPGTF